MCPFILPSVHNVACTCFLCSQRGNLVAQLYNLDLWYIIPLQKLKCPKNSSPACAPLSFTALGQELLYGNFGVWAWGLFYALWYHRALEQVSLQLSVRCLGPELKCWTLLKDLAEVVALDRKKRFVKPKLYLTEPQTRNDMNIMLLLAPQWLYTLPYSSKPKSTGVRGPLINLRVVCVHPKEHLAGNPVSLTLTFSETINMLH